MHVQKTSSPESIPLYSFNNFSLLAPISAALCKSLLTSADVELITGFKGVQLAPCHPDGFQGNDLHFMTKDGTKFLSVEFSKAGQFDTYKILVPKNFKTPVPDVGEEAFMGPDISEQAPYLLVFRKGPCTVALNVATTPDARRNLMSIGQLVRLATIISSRLESS